MSAPALAAPAEELEASRQKKRRKKKHREQEEAAAASSEAPPPPTTRESKRESTVPVDAGTLTSAAMAAAAPAEELEASRQKKRRKKNREQDEATAASSEAPRPPTIQESKRESTVPVAAGTLTSAATAAAATAEELEASRQKKQRRKMHREQDEATAASSEAPRPPTTQGSKREVAPETLTSVATAAAAATAEELEASRQKKRRRKKHREQEEATAASSAAPAELMEASPRPPPQTKPRVTISSLPPVPVAVCPPADTLEVAMAGVFWGVEVKPGEPYIHQPSPSRRLRITQALLGSYAADVGWSILECNVGNMNPVRICVLNPTNDIRDLEIEYEERESVFLSVSGSSSIHLLGRIYNHSASDDQAHTSNKLASKTETPACLETKHQGNEANKNKEPSLKEPNVTKVDGKNDASPKQTILGEDDYSDEHLPIRVAYEKRMATRKESNVVHTVPIQDHEITQDIVSKADNKNDASPEVPIISEASGKNAASEKQPVVGEDDDNDDHLHVLVAHKKRMATINTRKYKSPGMEKILSDSNNDHKIMDDGFLFTGATNQHNWVSVEEFYKGDGKSTASNGSKVTVEYVGKLLDGQIVDPMAIRKFKLGAGEVIPGWDAGISGMRVGSKRKVTIPPALGHGNQSVGMIPANSWLVYEFELKKVRRTKKASEVSKNPS